MAVRKSFATSVVLDDRQHVYKPGYSYEYRRGIRAKPCDSCAQELKGPGLVVEFRNKVNGKTTWTNTYFHIPCFVQESSLSLVDDPGAIASEVVDMTSEAEEEEGEEPAPSPSPSTSGYTEMLAFFCAGCEQIIEEPEPLYECGSCGTTFVRSGSSDGSSNRCPDCNKFGSKQADTACPTDTVEIEQRTIYACVSCDTAYDDEAEIKEHILEHSELAEPELVV